MSGAKRRVESTFLWGVATSSHQIEGSPLADGAGESNWYRFERHPQRIRHGHNADTACDHYRRWNEDVRLLKTLGVNAYRFSIAWPRVMPTGFGHINAKGLEFYDRLVDALLEADIVPFPTLHHWDLPAALDDRGGWASPEAPRWFVDYATAVHARLGDRVEQWTTLNEPWVMVDAGYVHGVHPPGRSDLFAACRAARHLIQAHHLGASALRDNGARSVGLVVNLEPKRPASDDAADLLATSRVDAYMNRQFLDPLLLGSVPDELGDVYADAWKSEAGQWSHLPRVEMDFVGINYYTRSVVRADDHAWPTGARAMRQEGCARTELGWEVCPDDFRQLLRDFRSRYGDIPLYVTENGAAFYDPPSANGGPVEDPLRVAYLRDHLRQVLLAKRDGVNVRGYFAWSFLDNFEWAEGFDRRFGLVHVDFSTLARQPKQSANFYRRVIESAGELLWDKEELNA